MNFYSGILSAPERRNVLSEQFKVQAGGAVRTALYREMRTAIDTPDCTVIGLPSGIVEVSVAPQFKVDTELYQLATVKEAVAKALKSVYRYEGPFEVNEDIPF